MPATKLRSKAIIRSLAIGLVAGCLVAACSGRVEVRGNQPDPERLSEIKPGEITKEEVIEILGSPSNTAVFGEETWYYINETVETLAFLKPEVVERQIVALKFDDRGILSSMALMDESTGKEIEMVDRTTPTTGHTLGFFEQIFGNFGRIGN